MHTIQCILMHTIIVVFFFTCKIHFRHKGLFVADSLVWYANLANISFTVVLGTCFLTLLKLGIILLRVSSIFVVFVGSSLPRIYILDEGKFWRVSFLTETKIRRFLHITFPWISFHNSRKLTSTNLNDSTVDWSRSLSIASMYW